MQYARASLALSVVWWLLWSASPAAAQTPPDPVFPGATWSSKTPAEVRLDAAKLAAFKSYVAGRGSVVRYGYMAYVWGNQAQRADIASAGKPLITHFLMTAVETGRLGGLDDLLDVFEPALDNLNASLGYKDRAITWRAVANMMSGYGVREAPGAAFDYSDYNIALYWDTLFLEVYGTTYGTVDAEVLRPQLMNVLQAQDSPTFMAFGTTSRQGRVAISVRDLARFGLLYLNRGDWNGTQLLLPQSVDLLTQNPPATSGIPRTAGLAAQMISGQRSYGGGRNQADPGNSYNFTWWVNGILADGTRRWPSAPLDAYMAEGHWGKEVLLVVPSLQLVATWVGTPSNLEMERQAVSRLMAAVIP